MSTGEADLQLVEAIERLRRRDGWTRTDLFKAALSEYVIRHDPGNPGLPLEHWTKDLAFSEAAKEKLAAPPPQPKPSPNYAEMTTEHLVEMYRHPWRLQGFDRQMVGYLLKKRGVDLQKIKKEA